MREQMSGLYKLRVGMRPFIDDIFNVIFNRATPFLCWSRERSHIELKRQ